MGTLEVQVQPRASNVTQGDLVECREAGRFCHVPLLRINGDRFSIHAFKGSCELYCKAPKALGAVRGRV